MNVKELSKKAKRELQRIERRSRANQLRKNKKDDILNKKRAIGSGKAPPFLVALISLHEDVKCRDFIDTVVKSDESTVHQTNALGHHHLR